MRTLAQSEGNANGHIYDIYLDDAGDFVFNSGRRAYGDILASAIRTLEGELQLDTSRGIPYQRTIWETITRRNIWEIYVRNTVTAYPFVIRIESFTYSISAKRELTYVLIVETDAGTVEIAQ